MTKIDLSALSEQLGYSKIALFEMAREKKIDVYNAEHFLVELGRLQRIYEQLARLNGSKVLETHTAGSSISREEINRLLVVLK